MTVARIDITSLSTAEKILLAEELWESARRDTDSFSLSTEVTAELQRRLALSEKGEMEYYSWEDTKNRLSVPLPPKA